MKIYSYGYSGSTIEALKAHVERTGALVADIRMSAYSSMPQWMGDAIERALSPENYVHIKALGNANYNNSLGIRLSDPQMGARIVRHILTNEPTPREVILLCGCYQVDQCHRKVAAEYLKSQLDDLDLEIVHLPGGAETTPRAADGIVCLSLMQPWASLMAIGAKKIETRSWKTEYRGLVAIHASKGFTDEYKRMAASSPFSEVLREGGIRNVWEIPTGSILAVGRLISCVPTEILRPTLEDYEEDFGDYSEGRYGWLFDDIRALPDPIPARGARNLWQPEQAVAEQLVSFWRGGK